MSVSSPMTTFSPIELNAPTATFAPIFALDAIDASGELYLYSKGDGVIRKVVGATGF